MTTASFPAAAGRPRQPPHGRQARMAPTTYLLVGSLLGGLLSTAGSQAAAQELRFRVHDINTMAEYSACAVFDVDRDGRQDVFSGGWWYRGPDLARQFVRDVEQIRGRFDDYSNLPLDIDGDGWTDVVSCNYRSRSMYWVRNPGTSEGPWTRTVIATPGPMETGRLVDVNGDGRLDVLPNGADFAGWWENAMAAGSAGISWVHHELPEAMAGHGIGAGDLDGDGRLDIITPRGWYAGQPAGTWQFHGEFRLHRDASVPILAHDVDADGDADLIWGRGHRTGLYWLEQRCEGDRRFWEQHAIDTTWSQAHSLLLADLDGDGRQELIAGKRDRGHDGRDVGEYDPLVIYWYRFDPAVRAWQRGVVSADPRVGFGVDPKVADLDGDGDLDVVAADRRGLYWCENLGSSPLGAVAESAAARDAGAAGETVYHHTRLLELANGTGQFQAIVWGAGWARRRAAILSGMIAAMGAPPDAHRRVPLQVEVLEVTETEHYRRQRIQYSPEPGDRVPAYLLLPRVSAGPAPALLCLHQTTAIGKGEPAGLGGLANLHYAHELAQRGFVCLVPDYPSFGDYAFDFAAVRERYPSGSMKAIWNNVRGIDLLESLAEVDPDRIGVIGHSLGGHNALFTAAWDQRVQAVVTSCGFTAFHHYYGGKLAGWTSDRYMPRIRDVYQNDPDQVPFDFYEVLGAIAPRAVFVNAPVGDDNFDVAGVRKVETEAARVYALLNAETPRYVYPDCAHDFPPAVREQAYAWLAEQLGSP